MCHIKENLKKRWIFKQNLCLQRRVHWEPSQAGSTYLADQVLITQAKLLPIVPSWPTQSYSTIYKMIAHTPGVTMQIQKEWLASYCLFIEDQSLSHTGHRMSYKSAKGRVREGEGGRCAFVAMSWVTTRHLASSLAVGPLTQHLSIIGKWAQHLRMGWHSWNSISPVVADRLQGRPLQGMIQDDSGLPGVAGQPVS